jgi:hypothetical protein
MHELGEHRSDGMDGLMSIEALGHEALYGALHRYFVSERDLVLDHDMKHGVQLFIRKANTRTSVIVLHKVNSLRFIDCEPFFWLGRLSSGAISDVGYDIKRSKNCHNYRFHLPLPLALR